RLRLAQLAADDDAWVEWGSGELDDLRVIAVDDAGRGELGGADLQPHELLVHTRARLLHLAGRALRRLLGLRLLRFGLAPEGDLLLPERALGGGGGLRGGRGLGGELGRGRRGGRGGERGAQRGERAGGARLGGGRRGLGGRRGGVLGPAPVAGAAGG